jgi:hypothetical protein
LKRRSRRGRGGGEGRRGEEEGECCSVEFRTREGVRVRPWEGKI